MTLRQVRLARRLALFGVLLAVLIACGDRVVVLVRDVNGSDGAIDRDGRADDAAVGGTRTPARCGGAICACDNGLDDDGDGLIDGFDPECTGPFDNDEGTFGTGSPRGNPICQDCFFTAAPASDDGDGCLIHEECIYGRVPVGPTVSPCFSCQVTKACEDNCRPRTPNGCDCFGCCTIEQAGAARVNVRLVDTCSVALLDDEFACPRCVPNDACRNPCGRCELCPGRTLADLPMDCGGSKNPTQKCDDKERVCTLERPCADGYYCQQGCCLPTPE